MTPKKLAVFADEQLRAISSKSGEVLYSGVETLRAGRLYLLGHNPGGNPRDRGLPTIQQSINALPTKRENSYLDTTWSGRDTLQVRVIWLLAALGLHPRHVAASNLSFVRTRDAVSSRMHANAETCWPVHQAILGIVKPRMILAYGNSVQSPYSFLFEKFAARRNTPSNQATAHGSAAPFMSQGNSMSSGYRI